MKGIIKSMPFMLVGLVVLAWGGVEVYQTTIGPRIHGKDTIQYD